MNNYVLFLFFSPSAIIEVAGRHNDQYAKEIHAIMEKIEKLVECSAGKKA